MSVSRQITAVLCAGAAFATIGGAFAQQPAPPRPAAQSQRPAGSAPAAPAPAAPAAPAAPQGPTIVQVKAEPSQTDWVKVCGKDPSNNREICYTTRDFVSDDGSPVLAVAIYSVTGDANKIVRFLVPLGLMVQPGVRFGVDTGQPLPGRYAICLPNGCFVENTGVNETFINSLKRGTTLNVSVQNQVAREVTFAVPLAGFGKAFDGAPIDPKVLEDQQRLLQQELQKRADEQRRAVGGTQPSPGSTAPAPPAAPAPGAPAQRP